MRIELKCACGAEALFDAGTYTIPGGHPDAGGRIFVAQVEADKWRDEHKDHATMYAPRSAITGQRL